MGRAEEVLQLQATLAHEMLQPRRVGFLAELLKDRCDEQNISDPPDPRKQAECMLLDLRFAETVSVATEIVELVDEAHRTIPEFSLHPNDITLDPVFAVFDSPVYLRVRRPEGDMVEPFQALSFGRLWLSSPEPWGLHLIWWQDLEGYDPSEFPDVDPAIFPPFLPSIYGGWRFGQSHTAAEVGAHGNQWLAAFLRLLNEPYIEHKSPRLDRGLVAGWRVPIPRTSRTFEWRVQDVHS